MREVDILLAEDNEDHVFLIKKAFSKIQNNGFKYVLHIVKDGEEVLKYVRKQGEYAGEPRPDLILLDLKMPKKDGFEVLRELKGEQKYRAIPVIVLTSSTDERDIMKSYILGSNVYVTKPLKFEEFVHKVMSIPACWCKIATLPPKNHRWDGGGAQEDTPS
jgi:CheY-like chemotaxis protein